MSKVAVYEISTRNKTEPKRPKKQLTIYTSRVPREKDKSFEVRYLTPLSVTNIM